MVNAAVSNGMRRIPAPGKTAKPSPSKSSPKPVKPAAKKMNPAARGKGGKTKQKADQAAMRTSHSVHPSNPGLATLWGIDDRSEGGVNVNTESAMNFSAWYAGVQLIAESLAILPRKTYRISGEDDSSREPNRRHPSWKMLNRSPDGIRTSFSLIETMTMHCLNTGNGFAELIRNNRGQGMLAHLLDPTTVTIDINQKTGSPLYKIYEYDSARPKVLEASQVLHLRAPGWNGIEGKSPLSRAREAIGLGLTIEKYGTKFFANGSRPLGFLKTPRRLKKGEKQNIREEWTEMHGGVENTNQVGILHNGWEWEQVGMTNDDAQFLASRKFQINEICRWLRIPPHMLGDMDKASYDNVEQMLIEFVTFTILPWVRRWESELNMKVFTPDEQNNYFVEFQLDGLLRADAMSRAESNQIQLQSGALLLDEWRAMENRPAYPDGIGKKPLIMASQMLTLEQVINGEGMLSKAPAGSTDPKTPKKTTTKKTVKKDK